MARLTLLTTDGCHLCELAERLVGAATADEAECDVLDIVTDPALLQRYGKRIPVLRHEATGDELGWPFDARDLLLFLTTHAD